MRSSTGSRIRRASSGSRSARSSMDPLRSANITVTCFRSPSRAARPPRIRSARCAGVYALGEAYAAGGEGAAGLVLESAVPQPPQKVDPASLTKPQAAQGTTRAAPHEAQKRRSSLFSTRHWGHCITASSAVAWSRRLSHPSPEEKEGQGYAACARASRAEQRAKDRKHAPHREPIVLHTRRARHTGGLPTG